MLWFRIAVDCIVMVLMWMAVSHYQNTFIPIATHLAENAKLSYDISSVVAAITSAMVAGFLTRQNLARVVLVGVATILGYFFLDVLWRPTPMAVDGPFDHAWFSRQLDQRVTNDIQGAVTGAALMTLVLDAVQIIRQKLRRHTWMQP